MWTIVDVLLAQRGTYLRLLLDKNSFVTWKIIGIRFLFLQTGQNPMLALVLAWFFQILAFVVRYQDMLLFLPENSLVFY